MPNTFALLIKRYFYLLALHLFNTFIMITKSWKKDNLLYFSLDFSVEKDLISLILLEIYDRSERQNFKIK